MGTGSLTDSNRGDYSLLGPNLVASCIISVAWSVKWLSASALVPGTSSDREPAATRSGYPW